MSKPVNLARKLLNEIASESDDTPFETLYCLMEILENKIEPSQDEIYLVTEIYQLIEKLKLLEGRLRKYVLDSKRPINKLADLYDNPKQFGTSKLFKE